MKRKIQISFLIFIFILLTQNIFFDIYRGVAFNVMPHDDYAPYLLAMVGEKEGEIAESPYTYRVLSVVPAIPFYYILPIYKFTNLEGRSENYIKAIEALSMVSYVSILIFALLMFKITKNRFKSNDLTAILTVLISVIIIRHTGILSADPIALMYIALVIYYLDKKIIFSILILLSILLNEKIAIIFTFLMFGRWIFKEQKFNLFTLIPILSIGIYFVIRYIFPYHGNESHLLPNTYFKNILINLFYTFSLKGLILNIIPVFLCFSLYVFALKETKNSEHLKNIYFNRLDFIPIPGLFVISHLINVDFNVGRIVMYCCPFYLPLASKYIAHFYNKMTISKQ